MTRTNTFTVIIFFIIIQFCGQCVSDTNVSSIINTIFASYDKKLPPRQDQVDKQVEVTVNIFVISMYTIDESSMDFSMSVHFRERWLDERLSYNNTNNNITRLELDKSLFDQIWMPDVYILNEKSSSFHEVTILNKMIHIYPDGTIQMVSRVTGVFSCQMYLYKYPFDKQKCYFEIESFGHGTDTMKYVWDKTAVSLTKDIEFPQFNLVNTASYNCEKNYYGIVYPCIGLEFTFERTYNYHIIHVYVPSILIVFLSWVSFWLDCAAVPARVSVGLLTVVTITTQSAAARANLPRVSYVKAIDVYMAACLAFVFLGIVEYACVNVMSRNHPPEENKQDKIMKEDNDTSSTNNLDKQEQTESTSRDEKKINCIHRFYDRISCIQKARDIDKISRVLFPTVFLLFNIIYWSVYFTWDPQLGQKRF
ncbi:hypothetical protein ACF0H5_016613 [Mactra antiquata]